MEELIDHRENQLLERLPEADWERWRSQLELVRLLPGKVLHEAGLLRQFVYFPTTAIVSLLHVLESGASAEVAVVGREGVVGVCVFMSGKSMPTRAVVLSEGMAYRLRADVSKAAFESSAAVQQLVLRFTQALITQMSQTAVCNRHHSVNQQLCRWLLLSLDRLPGDELVMTQELIASMLGVRREGVTEAALQLQAAGIIRYARGHIRVLDRPRLEELSCECYWVVRREYDRLLPEHATG